MTPFGFKVPSRRSSAKRAKVAVAPQKAARKNPGKTVRMNERFRHHKPRSKVVNLGSAKHHSTRVNPKKNPAKGVPYLRYAMYGLAGGVVIYGGYKAKQAYDNRSKSLSGAKKEDMGIAIPGTDEYYYMTAALRQVGQAQEGVELSDYRQAEDIGKFWKPGVDDQGAYLGTAYWLAVSARILKNNQLAEMANGMAIRGAALARIVGSSLKTGGVTDIYNHAINALRPYEKNSQIKSIIAALGFQASAEAQDVERKAKEDASTSGQIKGTITGSAGDIADVLVYGRGIITGEQPPGAPALKWQIIKWGTRAVIALGGYIAVRTYLAPEISAIRTAASSMAGKVKGLSGGTDAAE
jgi:hypothetical protein